MREQLWSGAFTAAVFTLASVLVAQTPSTSPNPSSTQSPSTAQKPPPATPSASQAPSATEPSTADANRVTVTGCLREASAAPTGTSGGGASTPGTADAAGKTATRGEAKFVLANAASSSETPGTGAQPKATQTYQLIANDSALAPHVGKKVELTGTVEGEAAANSTGQTAGAAPPSASAEPKLRVEAGKVVAANCTP